MGYSRTPFYPLNYSREIELLCTKTKMLEDKLQCGELMKHEFAKAAIPLLDHAAHCSRSVRRMSQEFQFCYMETTIREGAREVMDCVGYAKDSIVRDLSRKAGNPYIDPQVELCLHQLLIALDNLHRALDRISDGKHLSKGSYKTDRVQSPIAPTFFDNTHKLN